MRRECVEELINGNREIEFRYQGKRYSITYFEKDSKHCVSFCEFFKEPIEFVECPYDVLDAKIGNKTLEQIFAKLPDSAFNIY